MPTFLRLFLAICVSVATCRAQDAAELPPGVEARNYTGWNDSIYLNASEIPVQVVIAPAVGGRIVHFSLGGTNILFENSGSQGVMLAGRNIDLWLGGYQCDAGPDSDKLPPHFQLTEGFQRWKSDRPFSANVFGQPDPVLGIAIDKEFVLAGDTGELGINQRMRNTSGKEVSYCMADKTLCKGGGYIILPVNKKSRFKEGWSQLRETGGKKWYDGEHPNSPDVTVEGGILVAQTGGDVTRIGADSDGQWIAYARGKFLFVKYYLYSTNGAYTDGGNTVEAYFDRRATELDPMSPETKLAPGQSFTFPEKWLLLPLQKEVTDSDEARRLVAKIPAAPFGK